METQKKFPIIKKKITTSLSSNLMNYKKTQLIDIADNLKLSIKKSWKKETLIELLSENILAQFQQFYKPTIVELLNSFGDEMEQAVGFQRLEQLEVIAPLIKKGFFYVYLQKDLYILLIPDEIWEDKENIEMEMHEITVDLNSNNQFIQEENGQIDYSLLEKWKETSFNIYGQASSDFLSEVWNRYYEEKLTPEEVKEILKA